MRIILLLTGIWIAIHPGNTWARPAWQDSMGVDGQSILKVTGKLLTAPARANTRDWVLTGVIGLGVLATSGSDKEMRREARALRPGSQKTLDDIGHTFQRADVYFGTAALCYAGGLITDRPAWRRTGAELVVAFAVSQAGTQVVKHLAGRARPYNNRGPGYFVGPTLKDKYLSLWSGDATTAFAMASVLSAELKHPLVVMALYGLATTTAIQRIHADRHWLSDVTAAAVWSTAVGWGTVKIFKSQTENPKSQAEQPVSVHLTPVGVSVEW